MTALNVLSQVTFLTSSTYVTVVAVKGHSVQIAHLRQRQHGHPDYSISRKQIMIRISRDHSKKILCLIPVAKSIQPENFIEIRPWFELSLCYWQTNKHTNTNSPFRLHNLLLKMVKNATGTTSKRPFSAARAIRYCRWLLILHATNKASALNCHMQASSNLY